jgi:hypothetical protein
MREFPAPPNKVIRVPRWDEGAGEEILRRGRLMVWGLVWLW